MPAELSSVWSVDAGYKHPQPGSRLMHIGIDRNSDNTPNPTVIYATYVGNQPTIPSDFVRNYCKREGIRRIVVGHQPIGDSPLILSTDDLTVICGDTSYASQVKWLPTDTAIYEADTSENSKYAAMSIFSESMLDLFYYRIPPPYASTRGIAVNEVLIEIPIQDFEKNLGVVSSVTLRGVLSNGIVYENRFDSAADLPLLGREFDGWWAKGYLKPRGSVDEEHIVVTKRDGFSMTNKIVKSGELQERK